MLPLYPFYPFEGVKGGVDVWGLMMMLFICFYVDVDDDDELWGSKKNACQ